MMETPKIRLVDHIVSFLKSNEDCNLFSHNGSVFICDPELPVGKRWYLVITPRTLYLHFRIVRENIDITINKKDNNNLKAVFEPLRKKFNDRLHMMHLDARYLIENRLSALEFYDEKDMLGMTNGESSRS